MVRPDPRGAEQRQEQKHHAAELRAAAANLAGNVAHDDLPQADRAEPKRGGDYRMAAGRIKGPVRIDSRAHGGPWEREAGAVCLFVATGGSPVVVERDKWTARRGWARPAGRPFPRTEGPWPRHPALPLSLW